MEHVYVEEKSFEKTDFTGQPLAKGEYENCAFRGCDFSNSELNGSRFTDCEFEDCNLSMAKLFDTSIQDVEFRNCKMLGLHFEHCNAFGFSANFHHCQLNHSSFYQVKLKKALFQNCQLQETDFTESDLSEAAFAQCDFLNAKFERTILEKADLRSSINYSIDPESNRLKKAKFSLSEIAGLLDKYDIDIDRT